MFTPGLAIFYVATILRFSHVCGVRTGFWALERRHSSPSTSPSRWRDNMDRASQALAQGVPPGVPRSYRVLADHGNVPHSILHHRARGRPSMEEKARGQQYLKPY